MSGGGMGNPAMRGYQPQQSNYGLGAILQGLQGMGYGNPAGGTPYQGPMGTMPNFTNPSVQNNPAARGFQSMPQAQGGAKGGSGTGLQDPSGGYGAGPLSMGQSTGAGGMNYGGPAMGANLPSGGNPAARFGQPVSDPSGGYGAGPTSMGQSTGAGGGSYSGPAMGANLQSGAAGRFGMTKPATLDQSGQPMMGQPGTSQFAPDMLNGQAGVMQNSTLNQPRMMDTGGMSPIGPYTWGNYGGQHTQYNTLTDALGAIAQNHPDLVGQRVNLRDPNRFPELFQSGNYVGPNPASNYQANASYNADPNWAQRMANSGIDPNATANALRAAGLPINYTGRFNGGYMINGQGLPGAGEADFNNMFNLQLPGR